MFHLNIELAAIKSHVHLSTAGLESPHSRQPMSNAVEPPRRQCRHWAQSLSEAWKSFHLFSSQVFLSFWASIESIVQPFPFSCCQEWESWRCCLLSDRSLLQGWPELWSPTSSSWEGCLWQAPEHVREEPLIWGPEEGQSQLQPITVNTLCNGSYILPIFWCGTLAS